MSSRTKNDNRRRGAMLAWLPAVLLVTGCLPHKEYCEEKDTPDNTCFGAFPYYDSELCASVPGCFSTMMCVSTCNPESVGDAADAGTRLVCDHDDDVACNKLSKTDCALNTKCTWGPACGGTPEVDCASVKTGPACMNYHVCMWQIE